MQALEVKVVAELVAEGAEEGAEGSDIFADGGAHPDADEVGAGLVVAEKFSGGIFADTERAGGEDTDIAAGNLVEIRGGGEEFVAGAADGGGGAIGHSGFGGGREEG